eukprot:14228366-Alexandrium_andersonii.AAC.1
MSASLVGSEMCIRDRLTWACKCNSHSWRCRPAGLSSRRRSAACPSARACLLYTSDAADDM